MIENFPSSYRNYLQANFWPMINELPLLVDEPDSLVPSEASLQWGLDYLFKKRPDLAGQYFPIRFVEEYALCFRLDGGEELYEIDLNSSETPIKLGLSFSKYKNDYEIKQEYLLRQIEHIENKYFNIRNNDKIYDRQKVKTAFLKGKKSVELKKKYWNLVRSCVHDRVVAILNYKVETRAFKIAVDVFLTSDHPDYEKWNSLKSSISLLFCEAHKQGIVPRLHFLQSSDGPNKIPAEILDCFKDLGLEPPETKQGLLQEKDTLRLLTALLGLSRELLEQVEQDPDLSLNGICYLLANHIWSPLSLGYILQTTALRAELLFGKYEIERNTFLYSELLAIGANAIIMEFLLKKIRHDPDRIEHEEEAEVHFKPVYKQSMVRLSFEEEIMLPWVMDVELNIIKVRSSHKDVCINPMIRRILPEETLRIAEDIAAFDSEVKESRVLLYSSTHYYWFQNLHIESKAQFDALIKKATDAQVLLVCVPYEILELEGMVQKRMNQTKHVKI